MEKERFNLKISDETIALINRYYKLADCRYKNEFIEKAIKFYCGFLSEKENEDYFADVVTSTVKSIVEESENKLSRVIFKFAVELAITMNLIAAGHKLDKVTLDRLRGECVNEVKRLSGDFDFDTAELWQHGEL